MMGSLSMGHWVLVLLIVVLLFGTSKLRNLGKDLGSAVKGFKEGIQDAKSSDVAAAVQAPPTVATTTVTPEHNERQPSAH